MLLSMLALRETGFRFKQKQIKKTWMRLWVGVGTNLGLVHNGFYLNLGKVLSRHVLGS